MEKESLKSEIENIEKDEEIQQVSEDDDLDSEPEIETDQGEGMSRKIRELEREVSSLKDQLLRKTAEFQNYKRRTESEISNIYRMAGENLISELLPVLDDFDRMMETWNDKHDVEVLGKGVELVFEKFRSILTRQGLKEIEAAGKPFDVNLHDAVMQQAAEGIEPDTVTGEVEKGYYLKDKVIRHAKVIVSKKPE